MTTKTSEAPGRRHHRSVKNYLLDAHFQLKYAGLLFAVAAVLSLVLGLLLWNTSQKLVGQSEKAVASGREAVELARQVAKESEKVSAVVSMNIVKDPFYKDNPELLSAFRDDQKKKDEALAAQQAELARQAEGLEQQAASVAGEQRFMLVALFVLLALLAIGVGVAGIIVTHKVAGPIFKMSRQIRALGEGKWRRPDPLRKGDELVDFFGAFATMVDALRAQRERELAILAEAKAGVGEEDEARKKLDELEGELRRALEA